MRGARRMAAAIAALVVLCSGCRGSMELNELHIVHSVALDAGDNGRVKLSAEIAKLTSGQQQPKGMQDRTFILHAEGSNLFEAARLMRAKSDRSLLWGQTTAIIIGKGIARQGIETQIESFRRFRQFRNTTLVYMVEGTASEVLGVDMPNSSISALALKGLAEGGQSTAVTAPTTLLDIYKDWNNGFPDIRIPSVKVEKDRDVAGGKLLKAVGFYAFRGSRLAGFMPARLSKGYLRAVNLLEGSSEKLPCPGQSGRSTAFENTNSDSRIQVSLDEDGTPIVRIEVEASLNLVGASCDETTVTSEMIADWEKRLNAEISGQIDDFIAFSQRHGTDLLGIGERFHRKLPKRWKQMKDDWEELYPACRFSVTVNTRIDHTNFTI